MSWVLVIPFDVVKTVIQSQPDLEQSSNMRTIMHRKVDVRIHINHSNIKITIILADNLQRYGWRILFRGSWMLLFKSIPTNAATFLGMCVVVRVLYALKTNTNTHTYFRI